MPEKYSNYKPRYKNISVDDMMGFLKVLDACTDSINFENGVLRFAGHELKQLSFDAFNEMYPKFFDKKQLGFIEKTGEAGKLPLQNITIEF